MSSKTYAQSQKVIFSTSVKFSAISIKDADNNPSDFEITPRIAYKFNSKMAIGAFYSHASSNSATESFKTFGNAGGLLLQYYFYDNDTFQLFSEINAGYGTIKRKNVSDNNMFTFPDPIKVLSSGINLGGRYNFYKGLGTEIRVNNLINYTHLKDANEDKTSEFNLLSNLFNNASIGLSYRF